MRMSAYIRVLYTYVYLRYGSEWISDDGLPDLKRAEHPRFDSKQSICPLKRRKVGQQICNERL